MFKNALVSVSNKKGLVEFLKPLQEKGLRIVSTGGTYKHLKDNGLNVVDVSEQTGFAEVMDGRVKTLHPNIHMALLSREGNTEDNGTLNKFGLQPFDLLICNLYPFEESVSKGLLGADLIEKIDIGGPSMLRAAAKNFNRLTVICDPKDYEIILQKTNLTLSERQKLAAKVFSHTATYDSLVASSLNPDWTEELSIGGREVISLRYGENPQQQAKWYKFLANHEGLHSAEVIQGKPLSYNNILDLDAATLLVKNFSEPSVVAVKHNNPCGVATGKNITIALENALKADPISVFGGIVAANQILDANEALLLNEIFLECVIAPGFTSEALKIFEKKKNLRILSWDKMKNSKSKIEIRSVLGGFLVQHPDICSGETKQWEFMGETPDETTLKDLVFAEKVSASLKSNAIAIVKDGQTLGLGMGQVNRVEAVNHAIQRMKKHHSEKQDLVMSSDAFFPFSDSIEIAASAGVKWILQPGGSVKDSEVLLAAKKLGIEMVISHSRHFRH